jgi:hypothetical protein
LLIKYLQELDIERLSNELIENLDYITDEEITQLQNKALQIKQICKAAIGYRKKMKKLMQKYKEYRLDKWK